MFQASADERGTVQALAKELDSHYSESMPVLLLLSCTIY